MADEIITPAIPTPEPFDPSAPVIASAPMSIGGQQASAVKVTSTQIDNSGYTHDETISGGYFIVDDQAVNSEGKPVNDKGQRVNSNGKPLSSSEILADQYGQ